MNLKFLLFLLSLSLSAPFYLSACSKNSNRSPIKSGTGGGDSALDRGQLRKGSIQNNSQISLQSQERDEESLNEAIDKLMSSDRISGLNLPKGEYKLMDMALYSRHANNPNDEIKSLFFGTLKGAGKRLDQVEAYYNGAVEKHQIASLKLNIPLVFVVEEAEKKQRKIFSTQQAFFEYNINQQAHVAYAISEMDETMPTPLDWVDAGSPFDLFKADGEPEMYVFFRQQKKQLKLSLEVRPSPDQVHILTLSYEEKVVVDQETDATSEE